MGLGEQANCERQITSERREDLWTPQYGEDRGRQGHEAERMDLDGMLLCVPTIR